jgi:serine/threonine protein kinase
VSEKWGLGERISGRYEIHDIKRGGMGIVFLCYDNEGKIPVAIKTFLDNYLLDKNSIDRFIHEASTWVDLGRHRNIVRSYYVSNINFRPYVFLEYVVGDDNYGADLNGWIKIKNLDFETILNFSIQFCSGMMHAEKIFRQMDRPFVHRDIKPSNIMLTKDRVVKVTDFGLVKSLGDVDLSKGWGTFEYMSPEQFQRLDSISICSDIYSFGCVLFEMVCSVPPFTVPDEVHPDARGYFYKKKHLEELPPEPVSVRKDCPRSLSALILKCLEKKPIKRYQSFKELQDDLTSEYIHLFGESFEDKIWAEEMPPDLTKAQELALRGISLDNLGRYQEALDCYNQAIALDKKQMFSFELYCNRGETYEHMGQFDKAIDDLNLAININKNNSNAYTKRANVYNDLGILDKAIRDYNHAINLDPNNGETLYNRGLYYVRINSLNAALQDFNSAITLGYKMAYTNRGSIYATFNQWDKAIDDYEKAIENNPRDIIAYSNLGVYFQNIGQFDRAIENFTKALEVNPLYPLAYYNRGNCYLRMNQLEGAIQDYQKVIDIDLEDAAKSFTIPFASSKMDTEELYLGTYYNCGVACAKLGRSREAIKYFEKFIQIAPPKYNEKVLQIRKVIQEIKKHPA